MKNNTMSTSESIFDTVRIALENSQEVKKAGSNNIVEFVPSAETNLTSIKVERCVAGFNSFVRVSINGFRYHEEYISAMPGLVEWWASLAHVAWEMHEEQTGAERTRAFHHFNYLRAETAERYSTPA